MPIPGNKLAELIARLCGRAAEPKVRRVVRRSLAFENLEGRAVPSSFSFGFGGGGPGPLEREGGGPQGPGGGPGGSGFGGGGFGGGHNFGGGFVGYGGPTSSTLAQDARSIQQAFQTFDAAYLSAVAALRATATTTTPPTAAGIAAFDASISDAINALESAISTGLSNLTNTGSTLATTLNSYVSTLQTEVDSAATGLANSTNAAVLAMNREVSEDVGTAEGQATAAVLAETPAGTISTSTTQTAHQAVQSAYGTFNQAMFNAEQASVSAGTSLSTSAVSSAVATLQTGLTSAVTSLGSSFAASTFNPTATISSDLTNLTTALEGITAPTAGNIASSRLFLWSVRTTLAQYESTITRAVATAIQDYNNSLL